MSVKPNISQLKILLFLIGLSSSLWAVGVGDAAKQVVGREINGKLFSLSRMESRPKVVNFFWVECKPCIKELPHLAELERTYPNIEFVSIHAAINPKTESNYNLEDIQGFVNQLKGYPKTIVLGSPRALHDFGFNGWPTTYLLSAENKVEAVLSGYNDQTLSVLNQWLNSNAGM